MAMYGEQLCPSLPRVEFRGGGGESLCLLSVHLHGNPVPPIKAGNPTFTSPRGCSTGRGLPVGQIETFISGGTHLGCAQQLSPGEGVLVAVLPELS